jgi:AraC family transcriptional regulator
MEPSRKEPAPNRRPDARDVTRGGSVLARRELGRFRVSLAEFDAGYRIPSHYHGRACVSLILAGRFVQRFPGTEYDNPPGGLLVKPPEERHDDRWCGAPTRHVIVEPDPERHDELGPLAGVVERVGFRLDPWALGIGRRMEAELRAPDDVSDLALESLALELLVRLHRGAAHQAGAEPPAWLERVRTCLDDRHGDSLRLEDLAAEAGVHASQLSRLFRAHYGTSPGAYLRRVRLRSAMDDLAAGRGSLAQVAHRHGFSDQSHLTRWLKRTTGVTPAVYRTLAPGTWPDAGR